MFRQSPARYDLVGWILMLIGVAVPGIVAVATAVTPGLPWFASPGVWGTDMRLLIGGVGVLLCVGALGSVYRLTWSWWIAVVWGALSLVDVVRFARASDAILPIPILQLAAVGFAFYVWRRRHEFGVGLLRATP